VYRNRTEEIQFELDVFSLIDSELQYKIYITEHTIAQNSAIMYITTQRFSLRTTEERSWITQIHMLNILNKSVAVSRGHDRQL
jgi:hypothetical protein